jgi:hypothetical protein
MGKTISFWADEDTIDILKKVKKKKEVKSYSSWLNCLIKDKEKKWKP